MRVVYLRLWLALAFIIAAPSFGVAVPEGPPAMVVSDR